MDKVAHLSTKMKRVSGKAKAGLESEIRRNSSYSNHHQLGLWQQRSIKLGSFDGTKDSCNKKIIRIRNQVRIWLNHKEGGSKL